MALLGFGSRWNRLGWRARARPAVSVVVVVFNIPREAPRTLYSLSAAYQQGIAAEDYEVIVVDNGSEPACDRDMIDGLDGQFRLIRVDRPTPSPAPAVNLGVAAARADVIGVMIDGARIVTPGLIHAARAGAALADTAVVATLGWYLGYDFQRRAGENGYTREREDALLESIDWKADGYRLFEIGTPDESSFEGWLRALPESNALFMRRRAWEALGGMDERFDAPGGGLVNLDTYRRALDLPNAQPVLLLGEGTFHQLHGGIATNAPGDATSRNIERWSKQYEAIRGYPFKVVRPERPTIYVGALPKPVLMRLAKAAVSPLRGRRRKRRRSFDLRLWSSSSPVVPKDAHVADLVKLAHRGLMARRPNAAVAIARMAAARAPDEEEPRRLTSLLAVADQNPARRDPAYHLALAEAHRIVGDDAAAEAALRTALGQEHDPEGVRLALATLLLPGPKYRRWLARFHETLRPETMIEIGVADGGSLTLARPPTMAIGVDPEASIAHQIHTETHVFAETSDAFFARRGADALMAGRRLGLGFVDGLHLFEQALRDFIHVEAYCGPRSMVLIHDTLPLDEVSQRRVRETGFSTGDVWKLVLCLRRFRPDLEVLTIPTAPSGLTVVAGFSEPGRGIGVPVDDAVAAFIEAPFDDFMRERDAALNVVANRWPVVAARLHLRGVLAQSEIERFE